MQQHVTVTRSTCNSAYRADQEIPGPANRDPDSRFPAESGIGGFPDSRPNRESGIPSPIPGKKSGIGADSGDPIPDSRVSPSIKRSGLGIYSAASIMPVLSQAACGSYSGSERGNMQLPSASRDCARLQRKSDPASGPAWHCCHARRASPRRRRSSSEL
jgi:hypothetical protein